ncbi:RNA-binding domain-containing protein [Tilletiopsis washingtonensis]|uniref:RNA-binding domain-containing protein n=1 Tax=Tilletiopsis washingtonensis TaxID=58919 RepID=A0A316Z9T0_9BASI|nr:RNA-binding domain-containing protein [Tilletiopsis washingtonensis]PWN98341.1 RNA-binding domain-containing protein [Tilletiopsis washingtonensis]
MSAAGPSSASADPYAPFYYWDPHSNGWAFDYDAYYAAHPPVAQPTYDPDFAAQASAQASAYGSAPGAPGGGTGGAPISAATAAANKAKKQLGPKDAEGNALAGNLKRGEKRTTVLRKAVGKLYEDQTLLEWNPTHKRLFVGDLGNDVSDAVLTAAFQKYPSFSKARVVRKKTDAKSRGYGFVAFGDPEDFLKAWKEMDGKYIGSRPCRLKKASEDVVPVEIGHRKDRLLANNVKHDDWQHRRKMGGALGSTLRQNGGFGRAYGKK